MEDQGHRKAAVAQGRPMVVDPDHPRIVDRDLPVAVGHNLLHVPDDWRAVRAHRKWSGNLVWMLL